MKPDQISEAEKLNEFREAVSDLQTDDAELRRFLKARNYDPKKAEDMLRKTTEWKRMIKFKEAINYEICETVVKSFPFSIDGQDNDGRIAFYFPVGRWEVRKMLTEGWREEMDNYIYHSMASLMHKIDGTGLEQFVIIIDLAEMTYWKIAHYETMQVILRVFREYEQNFPERLFHAFVINAPWVLNIVFPLIKPLLTGTTLQKVDIFDASPDKYLPRILELIPEKSLPSWLLQNLDEIRNK